MQAFHSSLGQTIILIVVLSFSLLTCTEDQEEQERHFPRVRTFEVESITANGAVFKGVIQKTSTPVVEHGFVWSVTESFNGLVSRLALGPATGDGPFEAAIDHDLIPDKVYYVWAYAKTSSHTVYGEMKSFRSLGSRAPVIESYHPGEVDWSDTITIAGQYFSAQKNQVRVDIGGVQATLLEVAHNKINARVPTEFTGPKGKVRVSVYGNVGLAADSIVMKKPLVNSLSPMSGIVGQEITVSGNHFHPASKNYVTFNTVDAPVTYHSAKSLRCKIPAGLPAGPVEVIVTSGVQSVEVPATITIVNPTITQVEPLIGTFGDLVTITFANLTPDLSLTRVQFGSAQAEIVSVSERAVVVRVPYDIVASSEIKASHSGATMIFQEPFEVIPPEIEGFDPVVNRAGNVFTLRGQNFNPWGYNRVLVDGIDANVTTVSAQELSVVVPHEVEVHEASISIEVAGHIVDSPDKLRIRWVSQSLPPSYVIDNGSVVHFYNGEVLTTLGEGLAIEFTAYHVAGRNLRTLKSFEGSPRQSSASFILNGNLYVIGGEVPDEKFNDVWVYNFELDDWSRKNNLPFALENSGLTAFAYGGSGYLVHNQQVYRYDAASDAWTSVNSDAAFTYSAAGTVAGGYFYFLPLDFFGVNQVDRYDPPANAWQSAGAFEGYDVTLYAFAFQGQPVFGNWHFFSIYRGETASWENFNVLDGELQIRFGFEHNLSMKFIALTPAYDYALFSFRPDF